MLRIELLRALQVEGLAVVAPAVGRVGRRDAGNVPHLIRLDSGEIVAYTNYHLWPNKAILYSQPCRTEFRGLFTARGKPCELAAE